jgi:cytochrome c
MADLTFNKIAAAVLATGLVIFGLGDLTANLFEKTPPKVMGDKITIAEDTSGGGEAPDVIPDWGTVLPAANIAAGQATTAKCASCHLFDASDTPSTGPGLYGVVGRKPGSQPLYTTYDQAIKDFSAKNPVWTYDLLYQFLKSPQAFMTGTKMTFVGLKDPQDRINVIAYLRSNGSPNFPIPAPKPAAAAGASNATASNSAAPTNAAASNATAPASNATK